MDLTSGCPFWPIKNGLIANYPPLDEDVSCEVVVIGGGVTGALVAYHLADAGVDVVVLDKRDMGTGSTAGSTGLLQYEVDTPLYKLIDMVGEAHAVRSYELCRESLKKIRKLVKRIGDPCGWEKQESIYLASTARDVAGLRKEFEARSTHGFNVEWWDRKRIAKESCLTHEAAIWSKDAAQIDVYRFTQFLLIAAQKKGARLYDRTTVTSRVIKARGVELLTERGSRVRARKQVIATGYESQEYLPEKVTEMASTYAMVSEPLEEFTGWPGGRLIWETARPYFYLRTTTDGRAIIGGYDEEFRDPKARDKLLPAKTAALTRRFRQLFPDIKFERAYAWTGTFGGTKDGLPYIGEHEARPHTYFALGYGGNGITYSVIAAEVIRDLYKGKANEAAEIFKFGREIKKARGTK
ncbi:MAG: FAD-dependent oxidoreductase [Rariglobus sp.]